MGVEAFTIEVVARRLIVAERFAFLPNLLDSGIPLLVGLARVLMADEAIFSAFLEAQSTGVGAGVLAVLPRLNVREEMIELALQRKQTTIALLCLNRHNVEEAAWLFRDILGAVIPEEDTAKEEAVPEQADDIEMQLIGASSGTQPAGEYQPCTNRMATALAEVAKGMPFEVLCAVDVVAVYKLICYTYSGSLEDVFRIYASDPAALMHAQAELVMADLATMEACSAPHNNHVVTMMLHMLVRDKLRAQAQPDDQATSARVDALQQPIYMYSLLGRGTEMQALDKRVFRSPAISNAMVELMWRSFDCSNLAFLAPYIGGFAGEVAANSEQDSLAQTCVQFYNPHHSTQGCLCKFLDKLGAFVANARQAPAAAPAQLVPAVSAERSVRLFKMARAVFAAAYVATMFAVWLLHPVVGLVMLVVFALGVGMDAAVSAH